MDTKQLEIFLTAASTLHFGKAARELNMSEQPVGYQLKKLETELGFELFERTTRTVRLTPAGEAFAKGARKVLDLLEKESDDAARIAKGSAGTIRLGYESNVSLSILPDFVKLFRSRYPEFELLLSEQKFSGYQQLARGDIDGCLVTRYTKIPQVFEYHAIKRDRAMVALPADHPLAEQEHVRARDLESERYIGPRGEGTEVSLAFVEDLLEASGAQASFGQETESFVALLGLVAARMGFTIVTGDMTKLYANELAYRPLIDPIVEVDYGLALRNEPGDPASEKLRIVAEGLASLY